MSAGSETRRRQHQVGVRLTTAERDALHAQAQAEGVTPAELLRRAIPAHVIRDIHPAGLEVFGLCSCGHREMARSLSGCRDAMEKHVLGAARP